MPNDSSYGQRAHIENEIWLFDGRRWEQARSPTSVALTSVRCLDEKQVYACGMGGVLLKGRGHAWQIIEQDLTEEDFLGMAVFRNSLYVANCDGVFRLEGDELKAVDMRLRGEYTTAYLDACEDVLWSVGDKDLIVTTDGKKWKPTPSP